MTEKQRGAERENQPQKEPVISVTRLFSDIRPSQDMLQNLLRAHAQG